METTVAMMLWMDSQYSNPSALPDSFGDRYLCFHNPLFGGIRNLAISHGVRYQAGTEELDLHYGIAPLLVLPRILESGVVPYVANGALLRTVLAAHPKAKILLDELRFVKANYVMHESAHFIADRILRPLNPDPVVRDLLAESFANMVDSVGEVFVREGLHRTMYGMNSYKILGNPERLGLLRRLIAEFGFRSVCESAIWCYFWLNLFPQMDELSESFAAAAAVSIGGELPAQLLVSASPNVFRLNRTFRQTTTPLYFRLAGLDAEYESLRGRNLDVSALEELGLPAAVRRLAGAVAEFGPK